VVLEAKGVNGQLSFDGSTVVIRREGFFGRATHGRSDKALSVKSIGAVQFKPANALVNGHIQFSVSGESSKHSVGFGKSQDAAKDENAVIFTKKQAPDFEAIRDAVREAQAHGGIAPAPDAADQLAKLAALRDQGILTDEEFTAKKAQLLERM
jgi:hypothetical protein